MGERRVSRGGGQAEPGMGAQVVVGGFVVERRKEEGTGCAEDGAGGGRG